MASGRLVLTCVVVRVLSSIWVATYFNPDEYWQSVEVAHEIVFGYGYLTWEWQPYARLRGYAHPALFAALFKCIAMLGIDTPTVIRIAPRLLQAAIAAIGDLYLYKLARRCFGETAAKYAVFSQLANWFYFFCIIRTFSNCLETVLTTIALYHWPGIAGGTTASRRTLALFFAALAVIIRPTSALFWLVLGLRLLYEANDRLTLIFTEVVPLAVTTLAVSTAIDRVFYGEWTLVMINFIKFNLLSDGACNGAAMYGTHPWHWYLTQGFPSMLGTHLPLLFLGVFTSRRYTLLLLIALMPLIMSVSPHKEFRFILPALPLAFAYCGHALATLLARYESRKRYRCAYPFAIVVLLLSNMGAITYFSRWHQRAPVEIMEYIADGAERSAIGSVDFLTGCHATPFYSHVHAPIPMHILECAPRFNGTRCIDDRSTSESEVFQRDPAAFVERLYTASHRTLPTHIVMFEQHEVALSPFMARNKFVLERRFFYAHFDDSRHMLLYGQRGTM